MLKTILFDMDGTLLPMDAEEFTRAYFTALTKKLVPHGYEPKALYSTIWNGIVAMLRNDGSQTNEQAFWKVFDGAYGEKASADRRLFDEFYKNEFDGVRGFCGFDKRAAETVKALKRKGFRLVLATNPVFPMIAQTKRLGWSGCDIADFEHVTSYENSRFCKPNPAYYTEILEKLGCAPDECVMIGNDATEDMVAEKAGIKTFLLTDCLINKDNADISVYPQGGFTELKKYIERIKN